MNNEQKHNRITKLLALLVFAVFGLCLTGVLLTGAGSYRKLVRQGGEAYAHRVAVRYVTTRFHQGNGVTVEDFQGIPAMAVREEIGGRVYVTRVYCYDGTIRELFSGETAEVSPWDGQIVLEAEDLSFEQFGDLLQASIVHTDGTEQLVLLNIRSGRGNAP